MGKGGRRARIHRELGSPARAETQRLNEGEVAAAGQLWGLGWAACPGLGEVRVPEAPDHRLHQGHVTRVRHTAPVTFICMVLLLHLLILNAKCTCIF